MTNLIESMPRDNFVIYFFHVLVIQTQTNSGSSIERAISGPVPVLRGRGVRLLALTSSVDCASHPAEGLVKMQVPGPQAHAPISGSVKVIGYKRSLNKCPI